MIAKERIFHKTASETVRKELEKGLFQLGLGNNNQAVEHWKMALRLDPNNARAMDYIEFVNNEQASHEITPPPLPSRDGKGAPSAQGAGTGTSGHQSAAPNSNESRDFSYWKNSHQENSTDTTSPQEAKDNYKRVLGGLETRPVIKIPMEEVIWLNLTHQEGFVLSRVNGFTSYEEIINLCGIPREEALKALSSLVYKMVIGPPES